MHRLLPIEGLRAFLAIWVIFGHVMFWSGIHPHGTAENDFWTSAFKFLGDGPYAVKIFMIVSGFVIFYLLDHKKEAYVPFLVRRFFRLYPLYIILLVAALFLEPLQRWNLSHSLLDQTIPRAYYGELFATAAQHPVWNFLLHLSMLHGLPPDHLFGTLSCNTYIISAWSISVEWQFYLLAPLLYGLTVARPLYRLILSAFTFLIFITITLGYWPPFSAFLPFYAIYFFFGIASYFIHKSLKVSVPDTIFPIALGLAATIYFLGLRQGGLIPIVLWIPFLGLLCEPPTSLSSRGLLWIFTNPVSQYLGAISYGIYLSHELAITGVEAVLVRYFPAIGLMPHFVALLSGTLLLTILLAAILHRFVELPGIALGKKLAASFAMTKKK